MKRIFSIMLSLVIILNITYVNALDYQEVQVTGINIQTIKNIPLNETHDGVLKPVATLISDPSMYPVSQPSYFAANTTDGSSDYGYTQLNANEQQAYSRIKSAAIAKNVNTVTDILSLNLSLAQVQKVFSYFRNDNPQYFWLSNAYTIYSIGNSMSGVKLVSLYNNQDGTINTNLVNSMQVEIDKTVVVYLNAVKNETNPFNKELILHDMIVQNVYYNTVENNENHSIYGIFVRKTAVCEGYAKAFQYLLNLSGIDNIFVTGSSHGVDHAWNCVNINGNYYYVDSTWDDPFSPTEQTISHEYFNIKTTQLALDHTTDLTPTLYAMPSCTATTENYFVKEGYYYTNTSNFVSNTVNNIVSQIYSGNYRAEIQADSLATLNAIYGVIVSGEYVTPSYTAILTGVNQQLQTYQKNSISYSLYMDTSSNILMFYIKRIASNGTDMTKLVEKLTYSKLYYSNSDVFKSDTYSTFSNALSQADAINISSNALQPAVDADLQSLQSSINNLVINPFRIVSYKISGTKLTNITTNLTVRNFQYGLSYSGNTELSFKNASGSTLTLDSVVGTGTTMTVKIDGSVAYTYTLVIYGDVSGDGAISLSDLVLIRNHLLEVQKITGVKKDAGNFYGENDITINDLVGMMAYISGTGSINQNL